MKPVALSLSLTMLSSLLIAQTPTRSGEGQKPAAGPGVIVYAEGGAFLIEAPKGWISDHDTGSQMGICCVFYPEGSTWDDATTVMYPNIATKGPGQATLSELMEYDLSEFRQNNPKMTYEDADEITLKNKRTAKLRYFHGVNKGSSEAIAYIDEEKIVALLVVSSKSEKDLAEAMPLLRDMVQSYSYMDAKVAPSAEQQQH